MACEKAKRKECYHTLSFFDAESLIKTLFAVIISVSTQWGEDMDFEKLTEIATKTLNSRQLEENAWAGQVAAALVTDKGNHTHMQDTHIHRHTHIYAYIYTHTCTYIHTHMDTQYIDIHIHTFIHTHRHTYIHTYTHTWTHTYDTHIHTQETHTFIHTHTWAHTHIDTHTHMYTHTQDTASVLIFSSFVQAPSFPGLCYCFSLPGT